MITIDFASINWLAQIPFFIALCYLISRIYTGGKRGFVKELCAVISFVMAAAAVFFIALGVKNYFEKETVHVIAAIVLILILGIIYKLLDVFLVSLKLISKLPVINFIDKILGVVAGVAETVLAIWAIYTIVIVMQPGEFGDWIMYGVKNNSILLYLYNNNYMKPLVDEFYKMLSNIEFLQRIGFV